MSDLDDFKATYFDECSELLTELEEQFAAIEDGERGSDRLNAVFRAIHSIKGGAGAFGFSAWWALPMPMKPCWTMSAMAAWS
jgi:Chemotaxis protein histidine kinase and related kinases